MQQEQTWQPQPGRHEAGEMRILDTSFNGKIFQKTPSDHTTPWDRCAADQSQLRLVNLLIALGRCKAGIKMFAQLARDAI